MSRESTERPIPRFQIGDRVRYRRYGPGTITAIIGPIFCPSIDQWLPCHYHIKFQGYEGGAMSGFIDNQLMFDLGYQRVEK